MLGKPCLIMYTIMRFLTISCLRHRLREWRMTEEERGRKDLVKAGLGVEKLVINNVGMALRKACMKHVYVKKGG